MFIRTLRYSLFLMLLIFFGQQLAYASSPQTRRLTQDIDGNSPNNHSYTPIINQDGTTVTFSSIANDLIENDSNNREDVFLMDTDTLGLTLASRNMNGDPANGHSDDPSISADGTAVVFLSLATDLVISDTNGINDVFVFDSVSSTVERVSVNNAGEGADAFSGGVGISGDGRYVVFHTTAENLLPVNSGSRHVYRYDRTNDLIERVSVSTEFGDGNGISEIADISADGNLVVFQTSAGNLFGSDVGPRSFAVIALRDMTTGTITMITELDGTPFNGENAKISPNGRFITFRSSADPVPGGVSTANPDVFVYDRQTDKFRHASAMPNGDDISTHDARSPDVANNGDVTFHTLSDALLEADSNLRRDIYVYDYSADALELASIHTDGTQGDNHSITPSIGMNGQRIVFESGARTLVDDPQFLNTNLYLRDRGAPPTAVTLGQSSAATLPAWLPALTVLLLTLFIVCTWRLQPKE